MKKIIMLLLTFLFIIPVYVHAGTYEAEVNKANSLLNKENYVHTYEKYVLHGSNIKFEHSGIENKYNPSFLRGGFISLEEYNLSSKDGVSYLFEGIEFWTLSKNGTNVYAITYGDTNTPKNPNASYSGRATEFINPNVRIHGQGRINNPWTFDSIFKVSAVVDNRFATIESGNNVYVRGGCTDTDCTARIVITPKTGYRYIANDCNGLYDETSHTLSINNVKRDTKCNVSFGKGLFVVTLNRGTPNKIYLKYGENYYADFNANTIIRKIESVNPQTGYTFIGYYYNSKKVINGVKEANPDDNYKILYDSVTGKYITSDVTLEPTYEANQYKVIFNCNGGSNPPTTQTPIYDNQFTLTSTVCQRDGYVQPGWNTKADGTGESWTTANHTNFKWNISHDVTLYAVWNECPAGTYSPASSNTCTACGAGKWSTARSITCNNIDAGCFGTSAGTACPTKCPAGTYSIGGASTCTACGAGKWSAEKSSSCGNIDAGCYGTSASSACPAKCAKGSYSTAGSATCTACGAGKTTSGTGSPAATSCTGCTAVTGLNEWASSSWNSSNNTVTGLCIVSKCSAGYKKENNTCTACGAGKWSSVGSTTCSEIDAGCYGTSAGTSCPTKCSAGTYSAAGSSACTACGAGKWSTEKSSTCSKIDAGCYGTSASSACPAKCAKGSYSTAGSSTCTACGAGKTTSAEGATASSSCTNCSAITGLNEWASSSWNSSNNTVTGLCTVSKCSAGYKKENNTCKACGAGKWSSVGSTTCSDIEAGCYGTSAGTSCPTKCSAGTYSTVGSSGCTACGAGKWSSEKSSACSSIKAGCYGTSAGSDCPAKCAKGTYSTAGSSGCTVCGAGKTTSGTGTTASSGCTNCSAITGLASWATPSWNSSNNTVSGLCTAASCNAHYRVNGSTCEYLCNNTTTSCGNYGSYGNCSKSCGGGTKSRTRTCKKYSTIDTSHECSSYTDTDTANCNTQGCCSSYSTSCGSYGGCSASCGGGTKSRTCTKTSDYDGSSCGSYTDSTSCNTQGCCSSYSTSCGSYGACSASCGAGTKSRTCYKTSNYNGTSCGSYSQSTSCNGVSCGACFVKGTKVKTLFGYKDIDKIKIGDYILSYNEIGKFNQYKRVTYKFVFEDKDEYLYTVTLDNNDELKLTHKHRVYILDENDSSRYIAAEDLEIGDIVLYSNGERHKIKDISYKAIKETVYNLEINDNHNFYVTENEILVHNSRRVFGNPSAEMYK